MKKLLSIFFLTAFILRALAVGNSGGVQADLVTGFVVAPVNFWLLTEQDANFVAAVRAVQNSGGTGSQTPWTSDIAGANHSLTGVNVINATTIEAGGTNLYSFAASTTNGLGSLAFLSTVNSNLFSGFLNYSQIQGVPAFALTSSLGALAFDNTVNSNLFSGLLNYGQIQGVPNFALASSLGALAFDNTVNSNLFSGLLNYGQIQGVPGFLTANQTITLAGIAGSGSGTTSITTVTNSAWQNAVLTLIGLNPNNFLTANQTIAASGELSGSGATSLVLSTNSQFQQDVLSLGAIPAKAATNTWPWLVLSDPAGTALAATNNLKIISTNVVSFAQNFPSATNALPLNNGRWFFTAAGACSISNVTVIGQSDYSTITFSNSLGTAITNTITVPGIHTAGASSTNAPVIPAGQEEQWLIYVDSGRTNFANWLIP